MKVTELEIYGRSSLDNKARCGRVTFSDGKVWDWHRSQCDLNYYFVIDSGHPSQWSLGNYGRQIQPPKRIEALKAALNEKGEL